MISIGGSPVKGCAGQKTFGWLRYNSRRRFVEDTLKFSKEQFGLSDETRFMRSIFVALAAGILPVRGGRGNVLHELPMRLFDISHVYFRFHQCVQSVCHDVRPF